MSVRDDEFRDPNPGRGLRIGDSLRRAADAERDAIAARPAVPRELPTVGRSTASAFMRGRRPVPPNVERAVRASTAAGLPAEAISIDGLVLMLIVEQDGRVRLQTGLPDPDAVAAALRMVADLVESHEITGERVVDDQEADRT